MNNNIIINEKNHIIEMTKKFAAAAKHYGTPEYDDLQNARRDYPKYRVVTKKTAKRKDRYKGLNYRYMENYIINHNANLLNSFYELCGKSFDGAEMDFAPAASYGVIKKWFLNEFPELSLQGGRNRETVNNRIA